MGCSLITRDLKLATKAVVLPKMGSEVDSKGLHLDAAPNGFVCLYKGFGAAKHWLQTTNQKLCAQKLALRCLSETCIWPQGVWYT